MQQPWVCTIAVLLKYPLLLGLPIVSSSPLSGMPPDFSESLIVTLALWLVIVPGTQLTDSADFGRIVCRWHHGSDVTSPIHETQSVKIFKQENLRSILRTHWKSYAQGWRSDLEGRNTEDGLRLIPGDGRTEWIDRSCHCLLTSECALAPTSSHMHIYTHE